MNFLRKIFGPVTTHEVPSKSANSPAPSAPSASSAPGSPAASAARPQPAPEAAPRRPRRRDHPPHRPRPRLAAHRFPRRRTLPCQGRRRSHLIAFIGGSAELDPDLARDPAHAAGPALLSRALPLYLAEQVELCTSAMAQTLVSWIVKPRPGFIVGGKNWDDATRRPPRQPGRIRRSRRLRRRLPPALPRRSVADRASPHSHRRCRVPCHHERELPRPPIPAPPSRASPAPSSPT